MFYLLVRLGAPILHPIIQNHEESFSSIDLSLPTQEPLHSWARGTLLEATNYVPEEIPFDGKNQSWWREPN